MIIRCEPVLKTNIYVKNIEFNITIYVVNRAIYNKVYINK